jgi:hypothetical protein
VSWLRALGYWLVAGVLAVIYWTGQRPAVVDHLEVEAPGAPAAAFTIDREALRAVELRRGEVAIEFERSGNAWRVRKPAGAPIALGLIDAFVDQLGDAATGEQIGNEGGDPGAFGFTQPSFTVSVRQADGPPLELVVGDRTPTRTASYARIAGSPTVFVVGLNLTYYADLLFEAVR